MNSELQYKIRGLGYWLESLNPLQNTIKIKGLPLGLELLAYKRDGVGRGLFKRRVHEPGLTKFLVDRFADGRGGNFIDIGANIGYFSCLMARLAGVSGRVLAFEPEPSNIRLLERNAKLNRLTNIEIHPCALGAEEATAMLGLYKAANRGRHSLVHSHLDADHRDAIKVTVRKLDDVTRSAGISWSFMKIDVEGYEALVIAGAEETLARTETLALEYSPQFLRQAGANPAALLQALSPNFPHIYRIEGDNLVKVSANDCLRSEKQTDLIFDRGNCSPK